MLGHAPKVGMATSHDQILHEHAVRLTSQFSCLVFVSLKSYCMSSSGFRHDMSTLLWLTVETLETTKPVYNPLAVKQYMYLVLVKLQVDM